MPPERISGQTFEGTLASVNISESKGTLKHPAASAEVSGKGLEGDAHSGSWHRQVSLLSGESIRRFNEETGTTIQPGDFAENLTVEGLDLSAAAILDRFQIGGVELEVTQIGKECHGDECAVFQKTGNCVMPREGLFCRVLSTGSIERGDRIVHIQRNLDVQIITLSDRAFKGEYKDRSGPRIRNLIQQHFTDSHWRLKTELSLIPDDAGKLEEELSRSVEAGASVIITCGSTGIGPRDIAPDTAARFCDRLIPGIMDFIRIKYGRDNPNALLSRSAAGSKGETLIYSVPGSSKAAEEYMTEILKTLEHALFMVRGIDTH